MDQVELFEVKPMNEISQKNILLSMEGLVNLFNAEKSNLHLKRAYFDFYNQLAALTPLLTIQAEKVYEPRAEETSTGSNLE